MNDLDQGCLEAGDLHAIADPFDQANWIDFVANMLKQSTNEFCPRQTRPHIYLTWSGF